MPLNSRTVILVLSGLTIIAAAVRGDDKKVYSGCTATVDEFFVNEVWGKVAAESCLKCHKPGGDADDSDFILQDPERSLGRARDEALRHNRDLFAQMAREK